jgi:hypothetical protein
VDVQLVLIVILALLTINLLIVGVYVVLVLKDLRTTISKTNDVLDNVNTVAESAGTMSQAISNPVTSIAGFANTVASGFTAAKSISSLIHGNRDD